MFTLFCCLYRTFEETSKKYFKNIIKENQDYDFTIIINTENEITNLKKKTRMVGKKREKNIYSKNIR